MSSDLFEKTNYVSNTNVSEIERLSIMREERNEDVDEGETSTMNDSGGDDYLRRMIANLGSPTPPPPQLSPKSSMLMIKDENDDSNRPISVQITDSFSTGQLLAHNSPSYAAAKWAAKFGSGAGKSTPPPVGPSSSSSSSSSKLNWRDDFVAAVQANKRKRKAARSDFTMKKKKTKSASNKVQQNKLKVDEDDSSTAGRTTPKMSGRRRKQLEFTEEELVKFREPFRYGWTRELVYRKSQKSGCVADVYYFTPNGLRLRSMPEVDDYLRTASEEVTRENFCFRRITIGFDENPGVENVRGHLSPELARAENRDLHTSPGPAKRKLSEKPIPKDPQLGRVVEIMKEQLEDDTPNSPAANVATSGKATGFILGTSRGSTLSKGASNVSSTVDAVASNLKKAMNSTTGSLSPISFNIAKSSRMRRLRKVAMSESQRQRNKLLKETPVVKPPAAEEEKLHVQTKARKSIAASHKGMDSSRNSSFNNDLDSLTDVIEQELRVETCSDSVCVLSEGGLPDIPCIHCLRLFHRQCLTTKGNISQSSQFECNECSQFVSTEMEDEKVSFMDDEYGKDSDSQDKHATSVDVIEETAFGVGHRPASASDYPSAAVVGKTTTGLLQSVKSPDALSAMSLMPVADDSTALIDNDIQRDTSYSPPLDLAIITDETDSNRVEIFCNGERVYEIGDSGQSSPITFNFGRFNDYVKALMVIFGYLPIRDLLNVRLVCRAWNVVSRDPDIWKLAWLKGVHIRRDESWPAAVDFLKLRGTKELDITECSQMSMRQFIDVALPHFSQFVTGFYFGHIFPKLLKSTAKACGENLRRISMTLTKDPSGPSRSSDFISSAPFSYLATCTQLTELRVSAADSTGRHQRVYINGNGLDALASLTQLRKLVLFDIRALDERMFSFLDSLTSLRVLEIGDCQCWTKETFAKLRRLTYLRRLRLEYFEPGMGGDTLAQSISALPELCEVELVKYSLDYSYESPVSAQPLMVLSSLSRLHTLRLYPDLDSRWPSPTWRRTVDVLSQFSNLKRLELGIAMEENTSALCGEIEKASSLKPPFMCGRPKHPHKIGFINTDALKEWLSEKLPHTVINVVECLSSSELAETRVARWW